MTVEQLEFDELEYYTLAGQIVNRTYQLEPRRTLGHPLVLAGLRLIFHERLLPIQFAVSALCGLTAPLAYLLARRELRDDRAALLGGLGVVLWPLFLRNGATLYSDTAVLPLFVGFLLAMPDSGRTGNGRRGRWFGAGAILGLCMHYRPMYLVYSPFAALVAYLRGQSGRAGLVRAGLLAVGCLVVVLPWSILMSVREGAPVLMSTIGGEVFAGGFNPELLRIERTIGTMPVTTPDGRVTRVEPGKWLDVGYTGYLSPQEMKLPYTQMTRVLNRRALAWIAGHPGDAAYLVLRKLLCMWAVYPFWNGLSQTLLGNLPTVLLLPLALAALVKLRSGFRELALLWTLPLFVSFLAALTWGSWRFREPGDLGLILLAAALPYAGSVRAAIAARPSGESTRD